MTAILTPVPVQRFVDNLGLPLVGGKLFTYKAGTTTKQATFTDSSGGVSNTNPIILNFRGEAQVWLDPTLLYKFVLARASDTDPPTNPIWTVDNISNFGIGFNFDNFAIDTGTVNNITVSIPAITSPVAFTRIVIKIANTNTGATTITINGGTSKAVTLQNLAALTGGELQANGIYQFIFDGAQWQLQDLLGTPKTAAEVTAAVTIVNFLISPGIAYRYGTNTVPGTTDMTAALQATIDQAKAGGADAYWPADTYLVSTLNLSGSNFNIRTGGGRSTLLKQKTGTSSTTGQIIRCTGASTIRGINVGDLAFQGNISTDTGEFHHCIYVFDDAAVATISDLHFGDLYGTDIRGDVLYVGGLTARPTRGIRFGKVSGTNVFRNLLSVAGGEVTGDAVIHDGPVGYRDFDVEPNSGGTYQPSTLILNYVYAGIIQVTSDDSALINDCVDIKVLDLDFNRIAATTPAYTSPPGVNAQAIIVLYVRYFHVGYLKIRNYNYIPVTSSTASLKSNIYIDLADISNSNLTEVVFKSLFADQGTGGIEYLEIGNLICTLSANTKNVFNGNGMIVRVRRGRVSGGILAVSVPGSQFENIALDAGSSAGNLIESCSNSILSNITLTNAGSATLLRSCTSCTLTAVSGTVSAVEGAACSDNRVLHSTLNGIEYTQALLSGEFLSKAMADANQTLSAVEAEAIAIRCTGALTAQRNLVVPTTVRSYNVDNSTTGGFGVQVIGASGTGTVVANGKKAFVLHDGTNVVRESADV